MEKVNYLINFLKEKAKEADKGDTQSAVRN